MEKVICIDTVGTGVDRFGTKLFNAMGVGKKVFRQLPRAPVTELGACLHSGSYRTDNGTMADPFAPEIKGGNWIEIPHMGGSIWK